MPNCGGQSKFLGFHEITKFQPFGQKLCWPMLKKLIFDIVKVLNNIVLKLLVFNCMCLFWSCWLKLTHCNHFFFLSRRPMLVVKMEAKTVNPTLWTFSFKNFDEVVNEDWGQNIFWPSHRLNLWRFLQWAEVVRFNTKHHHVTKFNRTNFHNR